MFLKQFPTEMVIFTFSIEIEIKLLSETEILLSKTKLKKCPKLIPKKFFFSCNHVYLFGTICVGCKNDHVQNIFTITVVWLHNPWISVIKNMTKMQGLSATSLHPASLKECISTSRRAKRRIAEHNYVILHSGYSLTVEADVG